MLETYERHPLQVESILRRARRSVGPGAALTEEALAEDHEQGLTDQNHIGGMDAVVALGSLAGVTRHSRVLDLGCGLGGSARVLASRFGCRVLGVDLSARRIAGARRMTRLLGLEQLVRYRVADVMTARVESNAFDVLWGQSAWVHLDDRRRFLARWSRSLRAGGRVAFEDAFVKEGVVPPAARRVLGRLQRQWNSHLTSRAEWLDLLTQAEYDVVVAEDLSQGMVDHFLALLRAATRTTVDGREIQGWRNAVWLARAGWLEYGRIVAVRS